MKVRTTQIKDLIVFENDVFIDNRGYFLESYNELWFKKLKIDVHFSQDNVSMSKKGVLRGLHFQEQPYSQAKLVQVLQGEVFDVAVDLRRDSSTFKQWHAEILNDSNQKLMFIPEGFAHGFIVLSDYALFHYKCSSAYNVESSKTIKWDDKDINILWPIEPISISDKDQNGQSLKDYLI